MLIWLCLVALWLGAAPSVLSSEAAPDGLRSEGVASETVQTDNVAARLIAERGEVVPGEHVDLALVIDIRPHWHTYWRNPGDSGEPPRIRWDLPDGVTTGPIRWPAPEVIPVGPLANYGYSGRATHLIELQVPKEWPAGRPVEVKADADWLVCEEVCIPERGSFALTLATDTGADPAGPVRSDFAEVFAAARAALPAEDRVAAELERGERLLLRVPATALPSGITDARFFAGAWGLIEHAATQGWRLDDGELVLTLEPGATPDAVSPRGLLVVDTPDGRSSFEVDAAAGAATAASFDRGTPSESGSGPGSVLGSGLEFGQASDSADQAASPGAIDAGPGLPLALLFALLGGLALNLMPCVFPVLAIKALSLARQGGAPLRERGLHALAYGAGVLSFFALVGLLLLTLRAAGAAVGWGFQLQSPVFVLFMAYVFLVLGFSLAGAVTLGTRLMGIGATGPTHGRLGAFVTGGLAALVAAPCTAPFMGAALGYALTLPWPPALAIVLTLGAGMALPFMLLALLPRLADRLPPPGPWMEHLKQLLAFPMFATAAWLVWVLSVQVGSAGVAAVLAGMILLALALWLLERARNGAAPWRQAALGGAVLGLGGALWLGIGTARLDAPAEPVPASIAVDLAVYSPQALAAARAAGRPVFVNMTAAWCITCLVNERVALDTIAVARAFAEHDVLYLKGDWTNRDPTITAYLADFGRSGVPIYVLYPGRGEPIVLPQILTQSAVLQALEGA